MLCAAVGVASKDNVFVLSHPRGDLVFEGFLILVWLVMMVTL